MPSSALGCCEARFNSFKAAEAHLYLLLQERNATFEQIESIEPETIIDYYERKFGQIYGRISKKQRRLL